MKITVMGNRRPCLQLRKLSGIDSQKPQLMSGNRQGVCWDSAALSWMQYLILPHELMAMVHGGWSWPMTSWLLATTSHGKLLTFSGGLHLVISHFQVTLGMWVWES